MKSAQAKDPEPRGLDGKEHHQRVKGLQRHACTNRCWIPRKASVPRGVRDLQVGAATSAPALGGRVPVRTAFRNKRSGYILCAAVLASRWSAPASSDRDTVCHPAGCRCPGLAKSFPSPVSRLPSPSRCRPPLPGLQCPRRDRAPVPPIEAGNEPNSGRWQIGAGAWSPLTPGP